MKNFHILLLITVVLLSGCSKASQTGSAVETYGAANAAVTQSADTGMYAYIPYRSGRIDSYSLADGKFTKTGSVRVAPILKQPAATPDGKYLYVIDNTQTITRFVIGGNGQLSEPVGIKPKMTSQELRQCVVDPAGRFLFVRTGGLTPDDSVIGAVIVLKIQPDGSLIQTQTRVPIDKVVYTIAVTPPGDQLFVSTSSGILSYKIGETGVLTASDVDNSSVFTDFIVFDGKGSMVLLGKNSEYSKVIPGRLNQNKIDPIGSANVPDALGGSAIRSAALDEYGTAVAINGNRWLCIFSERQNQISEVGRYMIFKNNKVLPMDEANKYMLESPQYNEALSKLTDESPERLVERAKFATAFFLASIIDTVRVAPDGDVYASCTSGIYRFKSTTEGLTYASPAITWPDKADKFIGKNQAPEEERMEAEALMDGLVFVKRG